MVAVNRSFGNGNRQFTAQIATCALPVGGSVDRRYSLRSPCGQLHYVYLTELNSGILYCQLKC